MSKQQLFSGQSLVLVISTLTAQVYADGETMSPAALRKTAQALEEAARGLDGNGQFETSRRQEALEAALVAERLADAREDDVDDDQEPPLCFDERLGLWRV